MHTGTTDKPRLGYAKGGRIQCMADGGLVQQIKAGVNRLVGNNPGAMASRGRSEEQDAPPVTTTSTAPVMKAKGGKIPEPPKGAPPHPEATGTDTVPIMGTPGEFMVKKAAVDKLGVDFMEKINSIADGDQKPKLGKVKRRRRRGKAKPMADGGLVIDEATGRPVRAALPAPTPGTAVATQPYRPNFTMPKQFAQPPAAPAALPAPPAKPLPQVDVQRQPWQGRTGSPQAEAWQASRATPGATPGAAPAAAAAPAPAAAKPAMSPRLGKIARAAGPAGGVLAAVPEVVDTASVAMNPNASGIDVATQAAQGAGRIGAAGAGAAGGAALGALTGPLAPIAVPVGAVIGGALGYAGADKAIEAGRKAFGVDPRAPAAQLAPPPAPAAAAAPAVVPAAAAPAAKPLPGDTFAADPRTLTNPTAPAGFVTPAQVVRTGNSYSGAPGITGDIQITDAGGAPRRMGGGVSVVPANGGGTGMAPSSASDAALFEARKAAIARGDISSVQASYGGNFGSKVDPIDALINNGKPMTARKAAAIAQLQAARAQAENAATDRTVATAKAGVDKEAVELTNREKKGLLSAQDAYANAKTPAERAAAEQRLRAFQGKYEKEMPNRFTVVPGGQEIGADGVPFTRPASVINNQTGEFVQQPAANTKGATPRAEYDKLKKGDKYIGSDGKQYIKG